MYIFRKMSEHEMLLEILESTKRRYERYYQFEKISDEAYSAVIDVIDDILEEVLSVYGR